MPAYFLHSLPRCIWSTVPPTGCLIDELILNGVVGEFGVGPHAHFFH
jgi:hypothetical protein